MDRRDIVYDDEVNYENKSRQSRDNAHRFKGSRQDNSKQDEMKRVSALDVRIQNKAGNVRSSLAYN